MNVESVAMQIYAALQTEQISPQQIELILIYVRPEKVPLFQKWEGEFLYSDVTDILEERETLKRKLRHPSKLIRYENAESEEWIQRYDKISQSLEDFFKSEAYQRKKERSLWTALLEEQKYFKDVDSYTFYEKNDYSSLKRYAKTLYEEGFYFPKLQDILSQWVDFDYSSLRNGKFEPPKLKEDHLVNYLNSSVKIVEDFHSEDESKLIYSYDSDDLMAFLALDLLQYFAFRPSIIMECNFCNRPIFDASAMQINNFSKGKPILHEYCKIPHRNQRFKLTQAFHYYMRKLERAEEKEKNEWPADAEIIEKKYQMEKVEISEELFNKYKVSEERKAYFLKKFKIK